MNEYIDIYCERTAIGFLAEPINLITNACFLIAAFLAFRHADKQNTLNVSMGILIFFLACIGIGSGLFHSFATRWAMLADVLPILFFQIAFITIYMRNVVQAHIIVTAITLAGFFGLTYAFEMVPASIMNGSLSYAPSFLFLSGFAVYHYLTNKPNRFILFAALGTFALSLTFRTIDMSICSALPIGTHFLWHTLNSIVLYLVIRSSFNEMPSH